MSLPAMQLQLIQGTWKDDVDGKPLPGKPQPDIPRTLAFYECVVGIDMAGKVRYDVIATSAHLSLEACESWTRKGAAMVDLEIHRYDPRKSFRPAVQQACNIILRERDIVAAYVCIDAGNNITYRAITRREVTVYDTI